MARVLDAEPVEFLANNGAAYLRIGSIAIAAYEYVQSSFAGCDARLELHFFSVYVKLLNPRSRSTDVPAIAFFSLLR